MTAQAVRSAEALTYDEARRIVELASRAPSVHNTQPWNWRVNGNELELYADMTRRLPVEDPASRNVVVSCGAALHHCQVAARALGWKPLTIHLPVGSDKTLLARITLVPATPSPEHVAALEGLEARRTDRRRFTSWPVPDGRLHRLALTATARGCHAVPLLDFTTHSTRPDPRPGPFNPSVPLSGGPRAGQLDRSHPGGRDPCRVGARGPVRS